MEPKVASHHGRPRSFDRDEALQIAVKLFCKHGYEGVSIADLTKAMNIAPPSLYSAFGSKEALYREALEAYMRRPSAEPRVEFEKPGPIKDRIGALLRDSVRAVTDPAYPAGCMVMHGMLNCAAEHEGLADTMAELRLRRCDLIAAQLQQAADAGELPPDTDTKALARYLAAVMQGIAIQARDGATAEQLDAVARLAVANLPDTKDADPG